VAVAAGVGGAVEAAEVDAAEVDAGVVAPVELAAAATHHHNRRRECALPPVSTANVSINQHPPHLPRLWPWTFAWRRRGAPWRRRRSGCAAAPPPVARTKYYDDVEYSGSASRDRRRVRRRVSGQREDGPTLQPLQTPISRLACGFFRGGFNPNPNPSNPGLGFSKE
jgi:hypothetical protein